MRPGSLFPVIRRVVVLAALGVGIGWLSIDAANAQGGSADETAYYGHWVAAAAELTNVAVVLSAGGGSGASVRSLDLEESALRLDSALKNLLQTMPPEVDAKRHLLVLPYYQECASAVHALAASATQGDALEFEIARDWYVEALDRLRQAARQFSSPLARPE